jgi:hypothetical protein
MYCSGCGQALILGQPACPQCGRPVAPVVPPVPGMQFELENYAGKVRALSIVWFVFAGLSMLSGFIGLGFVHAIFLNHFGNWGHGGWPNGDDGPPAWLGQLIFHAVWVAVLMRTVLALLVGWGLHERSQWGRILAIVASFLSLLKFPFGTALGIWTLVSLMGYRNATLYEQLSWNPQGVPLPSPQAGPSGPIPSGR